MGNDSGKYRNAKGGPRGDPGAKRRFSVFVIIYLIGRCITVVCGLEGTATRRQPPFRNAGPGSFAAAGGEPAARASFAIGSESSPLALTAAARAPHVGPFRGDRGFRASRYGSAELRQRRCRGARRTERARPRGQRGFAMRSAAGSRGSDRVDGSGGVPAAATSGYGRSATGAAERFRLVTAGGDDRGRGCDAEARAAPDAAIGPGRAGSRARAAGRARSVPTGCQEQCLGQKGVRSRLELRPDALPDLRTPYWICSASALPPSGSVMGLGAAGG